MDDVKQLTPQEYFKRASETFKLFDSITREEIIVNLIKFNIELTKEEIKQNEDEIVIKQNSITSLSKQITERSNTIKNLEKIFS